MVELTKEEAAAVIDWLEIHFFDDIRKDEDADNMEWLCAMVSVYRKCKDEVDKRDG